MMQATVGVKALRDAVRAASRVCDKNSTIQILSMLKIDADASGMLHIEGTDLDFHAYASCPTLSVTPGTVCIPVRLKTLLHALPNWEAISIRETENRRVVIDMPDGRACFIGTDPADFPQRGDFGEVTADLTLECAALRCALERVKPFISDEETRYYLNGIMMRVKDGKLQFVATNGHILILVDVMDTAEELPESTVPRGAVDALLKMLPRAGAVLVQFSKTRVMFGMQDLVLHSKLIDGTYPDFARVIPASDRQKSSYSLNRASVLAAVRRLEWMRSDTNCAHLAEEPDGRIALARSHRELGECAVAVRGKRTEGNEPIGLSISSSLLGLVVRAHHEDDIALSFVDPGSPMKLETPGCQTVVMPMRGDFEKRPRLPDGATA